MKKIISLLLLIGCILSLASCDILFPTPGGANGGTDLVVDIPAAILNVQSKIDNADPDIVDISVVLKSALGDLNGEYNVVYTEDGNALITYSYELFNTFDDNSLTDEIKSSYEGSVLVPSDELESSELGGFAAVEAVSFAIKLDESKMDSVVAVAGTLSFTVKAADTESVLGVKLVSDAKVVISTGTNGVTSIAITYVSASGPVEISSVYTYLPEVEAEDGEETETE